LAVVFFDGELFFRAGEEDDARALLVREVDRPFVDPLLDDFRVPDEARALLVRAVDRPFDDPLLEDFRVPELLAAEVERVGVDEAER